MYALYRHWRDLFKEPFKGVTNNGTVRPGLFQLGDEGVPIDEIVHATKTLLSELDNKQLRKLSYHIDSPEWRSWSNPEFLLSDKGIRLDELKPEVRDAAMNVLQATLSPEGYEKAISAMRINGFLGELVESPAVMNEYSYNFVLFGEPSTTELWGISFYGHHLCLNICFYKSQIIISPWFTGAEPNEVDMGHYSGTRILQVEDRLGLSLMQSLPPHVQKKAQIYKELKDPAMPRGRWNRDDPRHMCGAYRDNRVVPYEGVLVSDMDNEQHNFVRGLLEQYLLYLPKKAREIRLQQYQNWFHETYFCWIGGYDEDAFYYRIQSPVIVVEFDHHSGVFLNNPHPAKFHVHTLLRNPNGVDYGMALRPLIAGVEQAFVWDQDDKDGSTTQGFQAK